MICCRKFNSKGKIWSTLFVSKTFWNSSFIISSHSPIIKKRSSFSEPRFPRQCFQVVFCYVVYIRGWFCYLFNNLCLRCWYNWWSKQKFCLWFSKLQLFLMLIFAECRPCMKPFWTVHTVCIMHKFFWLICFGKKLQCFVSRYFKWQLILLRKLPVSKAKALTSSLLSFDARNCKPLVPSHVLLKFNANINRNNYKNMFTIIVRY